MTDEEDAPLCPHCDGRGSIEITGCPLEGIGAEIWEAVRLSAIFESAKILPLAGGVLDQTASFMQAMSLISAEQSRMEAAKRSRK